MHVNFTCVKIRVDLRRINIRVNLRRIDLRRVDLCKEHFLTCFKETFSPGVPVIFDLLCICFKKHFLMLLPGHGEIGL
jgi:hypothetical protein